MTHNLAIPANVVAIRNQQRDRRVDARAVRRLVLWTLSTLRVTGELAIHLIPAPRMAEINWAFLRHEGSTDVITFDQGSSALRLNGEIFISVADAVSQAREFRTDWQQELARYVIHGLLHLAGYDDREPDLRRRMKRVEEEFLGRADDEGLTRLAAVES